MRKITVSLKTDFVRVVDLDTTHYELFITADTTSPFIEISGKVLLNNELGTYVAGYTLLDRLKHFEIDFNEISTALQSGNTDKTTLSIKAPKNKKRAFRSISNTLCDIIAKTLDIKKVEDGRSVGENGKIIGVDKEDIIIEEKSLKRLCVNSNLKEEWKLLKKHMEIGE